MQSALSAKSAASFLHPLLLSTSPSLASFAFSSRSFFTFSPTSPPNLPPFPVLSLCGWFLFDPSFGRITLAKTECRSETRGNEIPRETPFFPSVLFLWLAFLTTPAIALVSNVKSLGFRVPRRTSFKVFLYRTLLGKLSDRRQRVCAVVHGLKTNPGEVQSARSTI